MLAVYRGCCARLPAHPYTRTYAGKCARGLYLSAGNGVNTHWHACDNLSWKLHLALAAIGKGNRRDGAGGAAGAAAHITDFGTGGGTAAAAATGISPDALLSSYSREMIPVFARFRESAVRTLRHGCGIYLGTAWCVCVLWDSVTMA